MPQFGTGIVHGEGHAAGLGIQGFGKALPHQLGLGGSDGTVIDGLRSLVDSARLLDKEGDVVKAGGADNRRRPWIVLMDQLDHHLSPPGKGRRMIEAGLLTEDPGIGDSDVFVDEERPNASTHPASGCGPYVVDGKGNLTRVG